MTGIVTTLKTRHHIGAQAQPIHNFAFALIAPLRADDYNIGHMPVPSLLETQLLNMHHLRQGFQFFQYICARFIVNIYQ